jgi:hypothetical protein
MGRRPGTHGRAPGSADRARSPSDRLRNRTRAAAGAVPVCRPAFGSPPAGRRRCRRTVPRCAGHPRRALPPPGRTFRIEMRPCIDAGLNRRLSQHHRHFRDVARPRKNAHFRPESGSTSGPILVVDTSTAVFLHGLRHYGTTTTAAPVPSALSQFCRLLDARSQLNWAPK